MSLLARLVPRCSVKSAWERGYLLANLVKGGQPLDPSTEIAGGQQQVDALLQLHILLLILTNVHLQVVST